MAFSRSQYIEVFYTKSFHIFGLSYLFSKFLIYWNCIFKMKVVYRNNIVQRMGGEIGFGFLVLTYCENILDDERLDRFFGNFDLNALTCLQKELLLITFLEPYQETEPRRQRVLFRNEMMGLDTSVFPILEEHFVAALDDCFITGLDYELCKAYFAELRSVFMECTSVSKYRSNIVERMGGEAIFELLVVSYCQRLTGDIKLHRFFESHDMHSMTLLQKELILIAILQPSAENKIEAIERRVTSNFIPMFALGMNEHHFEMMERHFSAALYECLSRPPVIQICSKLFSNLISFFEEHAQSSADYDDNEVEDEDDEEDETLIVRTRSSRNVSKISRMSYNEGVQSHIANRISQALDASDRKSLGASDRTEHTEPNEYLESSNIRSSEFGNELASHNATRNKSNEKTKGRQSLGFASPLASRKTTKRSLSIGFTSPLATRKKESRKSKMTFGWKSPMRRSADSAIIDM